jgi:ubiquinone/menaquinone biosynthesis C-methylase UbiE
VTDDSRSRVARSDTQFGPRAAAYVSSTIHALGADLPRMVAVAELPAGTRLLDVGAGTGHTGLAFAAAGCDVTGLDMTQAMLGQARQLAAARGLGFSAVQGYAEALPFADGAFDALACRYCAHHFRDVALAIHEMRRVLRPGGTLVFVDHVAPEDDAQDTFINRLDWLRDPSHHREPRLSEYRAWFSAADLQINLVEPWRERMWADEWFTRAGTPPAREAEARALLAGASPAMRATFAITDDPLGFELHCVLLRARGV